MHLTNKIRLSEHHATCIRNLKIPQCDTLTTWFLQNAITDWTDLHRKYEWFCLNSTVHIVSLFKYYTVSQIQSLHCWTQFQTFIYIHGHCWKQSASCNRTTTKIKYQLKRTMIILCLSLQRYTFYLTRKNFRYYW